MTSKSSWSSRTSLKSLTTCNKGLLQFLIQKHSRLTEGQVQMISSDVKERNVSHRQSLTGQGLRTASTAYGSVQDDLYSIWLFTYSDLKTIVGPKTAFGIFNSLQASAFDLPCLQYSTVLKRFPLVLFWTWINLLPFSIDNQRQPKAIKEDGINKPWRPMPSQRMTPRRAKIWMLGLYPLAIMSSVYVGALRQCLCLICLGIWYNDLGGADRNPLIRNFINSCGFICYTSGAMEVAYGSWIPLTPGSPLFRWFSVIAAVVLTTVHTQDMCDQAGDSIRGRWTVPLVLGDGPSRITIAISMAVWSWFGPWFWGLHTSAYILPVGLGLAVISRTLILRTIMDDKRTFQLWNLWIVMFYFLPLLI